MGGRPGISSAAGGASLPAHTPAPWHTKPGDTSGFKTHSGGVGVYAQARPEDDFFILKIAEIDTNAKPREAEANARLIIAAPKLHAAVVELRAALARALCVGSFHPTDTLDFGIALESSGDVLAEVLGAPAKDGTAEPLSRSGKTQTPTPSLGTQAEQDR